VAGYGLFQIFGWAAIHQGSTRIDASLGNSAYMAVYMLLNAGLAAYMYFVARARKIANASFLVWAYPILAVLFSIELVQTATRGTILGLIGGIMLALFLYAIFAKGSSKLSRQISGGIIAAIVLLGVVFWMNRGAAFIQKNEILNRMANISWHDSSGQARQFIWPMALKGAAERPLFGWGQENFNYIFNADYNPKMWGQEQWFDRAHSVFLDWLSASGIVGLVAYLALYVLFLTAIWRASSLSIAKKSVLTGILAGYAIHNVFVFDNLASYVLFFAMLGFASSIQEAEVPAWMGRKPLRADAVEYIVAPIAIVALIAVFYFVNIRSIQANTRLISALRACSSTPDAAIPAFNSSLSLNAPMSTQEIREQILSCTGNVIAAGNNPQLQAAQQGLFGLAVKSIEDQTMATPKDARIYVLGGSFLNQVGKTTQAAPLLEKAHELSPAKQTIDLELATSYVNMGKTKEAVALLKQAYDEDPAYPDARTAYAISLVLDGQEALSRTMFNNDPAIFDTERMATVYVSLKKYSQAIAIFQKLLAADPGNVQLTSQLAQTQYTAGMITQAIATMRGIEAAHPEYKDSIEAAIKQIQK
jgi:tetratricopeptide (TPR) repeat protein